MKLAFFLAGLMLAIALGLNIWSEDKPAIARTTNTQPIISITVAKNNGPEEVTYTVVTSSVTNEKDYLTGKTVSIRSTTVIFSKNLFGNPYQTKEGKFNRTKDLNTVSDKLMDELLDDPLFSEGGVNILDNKLTIVETGTNQTDKQIEWLIPRIERLFKVKLVRK